MASPYVSCSFRTCLFVCLFTLYQLNVCVSPEKFVSKLTIMWWYLAGRAFGKGLSHWSGDLTKDFRALMKEIQKVPSPFCSLRTQEEAGKMTIYEPRWGFSSDTKSAGASVLDFTVSWPERDKCSLFNILHCYDIFARFIHNSIEESRVYDWISKFSVW